jgi:uncharacterized integral membrane protein
MLLVPLAFLISIAAIWFSIHNGFFVTVTFFGTSYYQPLTMVLLVIFVAGLIAGFLLTFANIVRKSSEISDLKKRVTELEIEQEKDAGVVYQSPGLGQEGDNLI